MREEKKLESISHWLSTGVCRLQRRPMESDDRRSRHGRRVARDLRTRRVRSATHRTRQTAISGLSRDDVTESRSTVVGGVAGCVDLRRRRRVERVRHDLPRDTQRSVQLLTVT